MTLHSIATRLGKFTIDNSPAILTGFAVAGIVTTAYLTGRATVKYTRHYDHADIVMHGREKRELNVKEKLSIASLYYWPAALMGVATITACLSAHQISSRRTAAVAAAYKLTERAFSEYKSKVMEKIGHHKEEDIRASSAQADVDAHPTSSRMVIVTGGSVLCFERFTSRYFLSDMETLKKAQNDINYKVLNDGYASLSDFYDKVRLPHTSMSDDIGWNSDRLLELEFSTVMSEDQKPCIAFEYTTHPIGNFHHFH